MLQNALGGHPHGRSGGFYSPHPDPLGNLRAGVGAPKGVAGRARKEEGRGEEKGRGEGKGRREGGMQFLDLALQPTASKH